MTRMDESSLPGKPTATIPCLAYQSKNDNHYTMLKSVDVRVEGDVSLFLESNEQQLAKYD
jgi:hypothetical protein